MKKVFDILKDIFFTFGILTAFFSIFAYFAGEKAKEILLIFEYGNKSLSLSFIIQLLFLSAVSVIFRSLLNSDFLIKRVSFPLRHITLFILVFIILVITIFKFTWFVSKEPLPWIITGLSFIIIVTSTTLFANSRHAKENEKLQKALKNLK